MSLTEKERERELIKIELKVEDLIKTCTKILENVRSVETEKDSWTLDEMKRLRLMMFLPIILGLREELVDYQEFAKKD